MKRLFLTTALILTACSSSWAIPMLQLYSPDASYNFTTESWETVSGEFELWVVVQADHPQGQLTGINLVAALPKRLGQDPASGQIDITSINSVGGFDLAVPWVATFDESNDLYGHPPIEDPLPPHDQIYPTNYWEVAIPSSAPPYVELTDYQPGGFQTTNTLGNVYKFNVTTSYDFVTFDAYGWLDDKRKFAPFSHDLHTGVVPEPATLLLFGLGLAGAGVVRRFKKSA